MPWWSCINGAFRKSRRNIPSEQGVALMSQTSAKRANGGFRESHKRSLVKSLSYRLFGLFATAGVTWIVTGSARAAVAVGALDTLVKIFGYYFHERVWENISFGRPRPPDYEI